MRNLTGLSDTDRTFILIDGAKVSDLAQAIYCDEETPRCDALYRGTELSELLEISPWLVETDMASSLARRCFGDWQHLGAAILLQARCEFDEVINHLRGLLIARLETGDKVIFRFYDPEIARHLLKRDEVGGDLKRLMGPCSMVAIQDRRTGEWENFYSAEPSTAQQSELFDIREEHQVAMEKAAEQTALRKLELHTASYFPHMLRQVDKAGQNWAVVSTLIEAAKSQGLYSARDIALYINTIGWLGQHAFEDGHVQHLWEDNSASPGKAIARIAEFAETKSTEGLVHG